MVQTNASLPGLPKSERQNTKIDIEGPSSLGTKTDPKSQKVSKSYKSVPKVQQTNGTDQCLSSRASKERKAKFNNGH